MRPRSCIPLVFSCAIFAVDLLGQSGSAEVRDSTVQDEALRYSDAVAFKTWTTGSELFFEVEMSKPHIEGMYTCLHVYLDADANPRTGIQGAEIWLRASVGSRYHPMSFKPKKGKAAKDIQRASLSRVVKGRTDEDRGGGKTWLHTTVLPKPEIETKKIRFKVSTSVLRSAGARYGSVTGVMAEVETTCTDQPLMLRHVCNDEGVNITLDGRDGDWSHPQIARDPGGELHKVGQILDLTSLRAEHDSDYLYACVQLAEEGLRKDSMNTSDVSRFDGVTFYIEPLFPRYQSPKKLFIRYGRGGHPTSPRDVLRSRYFGMRNPGGWRGSVSGKTVEIRVNRASGQNDFRVWAWSDLRRVDRVPDEGWMKIDWGKSK